MAGCGQGQIDWAQEYESLHSTYLQNPDSVAREAKQLLSAVPDARTHSDSLAVLRTHQLLIDYYGYRAPDSTAAFMQHAQAARYFGVLDRGDFVENMLMMNEAALDMMSHPDVTAAEARLAFVKMKELDNSILLTRDSLHFAYYDSIKWSIMSGIMRMSDKDLRFVVSNPRPVYPGWFIGAVAIVAFGFIAGLKYRYRRAKLESSASTFTVVKSGMDGFSQVIRTEEKEEIKYWGLLRLIYKEKPVNPSPLHQTDE